MVRLVERERQLDRLHEALRDVLRERRGRLMLVSGEAGAGKTSLIRTFLAQLPARAGSLLGGCDSLRTARPLGPVLDWAATGPAGFAGRVEDAGQPRQVQDAVLELLCDRPRVAVIEDLHWADDATLDLLLFLGRRADRLRSLIVVTYREDEARPGTPLALLLGDLATTSPSRIAVPALTREGIAELSVPADGLPGRPGEPSPSPVDVEALFRRTGGNAFFVTECLSSGDDLPATTRDAVIARMQRLGPAGRDALQALSVSPAPVELWFAHALGVGDDRLDDCVAAGVLLADGARVRFRHELAREAVESTLPPGRRRSLHERALRALEGRDPVDAARATHHAAGAEDVVAVLRHGPPAADAAVAAGSRREAVAHLELTLDFAGRFAARSEPPGPEGAQLTRTRRRELLVRLGDQCEILGRHARATQAYRQAIDLTDEADEAGRGALLLRLWNPLSFAGHLDEAGAALDGAIDVLSGGAPGPELALAYAQRCAHLMLSRRLRAAEPWGRRAMDLARAHQDDETLAYACIQSGIARWMSGASEGLDRIRDGIAIAERRGLHRLVALGLSQIGSGGGENRCYAEAVAALQECVAYADEHELGSRGLYSAAWLGRCQVELGRWDAATVTLGQVIRSPRAEGVTVMTALTALGRLRARRGDPDPWTPLTEALRLARHTGHLQRLWPVVAARAEAAWLEGRLPDEVGSVAEVHRLAVGLDQPWAVEELGLWLGLAGAGPAELGRRTPFGLQAAGEHRRAASAWDEIGCPYERAQALAAGPEDADQLTALGILRDLGAAPAVRRLSQHRRAAGRPIPRGPNGATRQNVAGLTDREIQVLRLVAVGRTNAQIGSELQLSPKTVEHHVSHLLGKLAARSRAEAVGAAVAAGLELI